MGDAAPVRLLAALALSLAACVEAPHRAGAPAAREAPSLVRALPDRPSVAVIVREGDPEGAFSVAVTTEGVAEERGPEAAVALAAVAEARLSARGSGGHAPSLSVATGWDGFRLRGLVADAAQARTLVGAVREALLAPIAKDAPEVAAAQRKLDALAKRPLSDMAFLPAARCRSEVFAIPGQERTHVTAETLEGWRASAVRRDTVAMAAVGSGEIVEAVVGAVAHEPAWPAPAPVSASAAPAPAANVTVYDASADLPPRAARITLVLPTSSATHAVAAATRAGDPRGALVARLLALEAPAKLEDVTATAHRSGGCVALTLSLAPHDLASDGTVRVATAAALATRELSAELRELASEQDLGRAFSASGLGVAERAGDPREAADRAAWWTLTQQHNPPRAGPAGPVSVAIGLTRAQGVMGGDADFAGRAAAVRAELERAELAAKEPVVELRTRVERGQGELWLLFGSPCGTLAEVDADAGLGASVAFAAAERATELPRAEGVGTEAWVTVDGIGVMAHATARPGESSASLAKRVGDSAAQSFSAEPLDADIVGRARASLLARAMQSQDARSFATLAGVLTPGHPSWLSPLGTGDALGRSSDAGVIARAAALRAGPLRVAVLANSDANQAGAVLAAVDRWVARRPRETRSCPTPTQAVPARPGTYGVEVPGAGASEAWIAVALPQGDAAIRARATVLAAAIDGPDGLLSHALGSGVAQSWGARVVGPSHAPALVLRVVAPEGALDTAVTQTKALLETLRQGSLTEVDRARAIDALAAADLAARLEPRGRLAALFRGDPEEPWSVRAPALDALRSFAATTLRPEGLVIVAARPPRSGKGS